MKRVRAWDTECVVYDQYGRSVNPFAEGAWVVCHGWMDFDREGFVAAGCKVRGTRPVWRYYTEPPADGWLKEVLECDLLCGANIKFDLLLALYKQPENYKAYREFVNRGGRIWDIQQAEYILEGHDEESMYLSLDQVAVRYGGNLKHDQVSALIKQGTPVNQIDKGLLLQYLCGVYTEDTCEHGDLGNTLLAAIHQIQEARRQGVLTWMRVEMLALQCTTEMELNGAAIDWDKAAAARARAVQRLEDAQKTLQQYIPEGAIEYFSWGSWRDKSRLLFGGVKEVEVPGFKSKAGETRERMWPLDQQDYATESYEVYDINPDGTPVCGKSGIYKDVPKPRKAKGIDPSRPKGKKTTRSITFPRLVEPQEGWEASEEGFWKTDAETISRLPDIPAVQALKEVATWLKDISVSYYTEQDGQRSGGLWACTMPDGTIHPQFRHNGTITGRLSSSQPNFQNQSKVGEIKTCLVSRYPGGKIIQGDATSLENYVMLWLSGCKGYYTLISEGLDVHSYVAMAGDKQAAIDLKARVDAGDAEAKQIRQDAKGVNFSMGYGGGAASIAYKNQMDIEKVKEMMEGNRKAFAGYWAFQDQVYDLASSSVVYSGDVSRHPLKPTKTWRHGYGTWRAPHGLKWHYPLTPTPQFVLDNTGATESISPTQAKNLHVQGTGASYMKAVLAVQFLLYMQQEWMSPIKFIATVHDAAYWDSPEDLAEKAGKVQQATLDAGNEVLTRAGIDVIIPVPAVVTVGPCWKELEGDWTVPKQDPYVAGVKGHIHKHIIDKVFV